MSDKSRAPRKVAIADHLWNAFAQMAEEMGSDREGLINQAMFMFARLNGFLDAGSAQGVSRNQKGAESVAAPPVLSATPAAAAEEDSESKSPSGRDAQRREVQDRVLETAAQLERDIKVRNSKVAAPEPEPEPEPDPEPEFGEDEESAVSEPVFEDEIEEGDEADSAHGEDESAEDEDYIEDDEIDDDEIVDELMGEVARKNLYLMSEEGELDKVAKDRFLIGRGKHCDFIIQSGKVSREHAVIVRENDEFFIEDLGSSNGTWNNKKRIKRRKIEDGDEYFICSEKVKTVIR